MDQTKIISAKPVDEHQQDCSSFPTPKSMGQHTGPRQILYMQWVYVAGEESGT